jgi:TrmH family RNA methyltransferase
MQITSRDNSLLRQARSVRDGKDVDFVFIEGLRLAEEALLSGLHLEAVIYSDEIARKERAANAIQRLSKASSRTASVSEKLLETISYTKTPQGIVVLARRPESSAGKLSAAIDPTSLLVVLHRINNPANVGAILRTAEAAGAAGVITTQNTSNPFSPRSLRGAMGSAFRVPIWQGPEFMEMIDWCKARKITTVATDASATHLHSDVDWTKPSALILGPESTGLTDDETGAAKVSVRIPMKGTVESLNVSVAAGILLFEAARQRSLKR